MNRNRLSVIIPVLNEAGNIAELINRIDQALTGTADYELIFIDDHSTDGTRDKVRELANFFPISLYEKKGKRGKAQSLLEGFAKAKYNLIGFIDGDLQYPPEALPQMLKKIEKGFDIVVAKRNESKLSFKRRLASRVFNLLFAKWLHGLGCDVQSGFKIFKTKILNEVKVSPTPWTFDLEFLLKSRHYGYRIAEVDIMFENRRSGQSKVKILKVAYEIGLNALKLKLTPNQILEIIPELKMIGAGVAFRKKRFITHTTLKQETSAIQTFARWQKIFIFFVILLISAGLYNNPMTTAIIITALMSAVYFIDVLFNFYLVTKSLKNSPEIKIKNSDVKLLDDNSLPVYSILCPLYKEAEVLPSFLSAIKKIDWPKNRLDVLLLLEEDDQVTVEMATKLDLPDYVRAIVVPDSFPKTKPKACNYGLGFARGEYLVIYDAEDIPDPLQLKKAYLGFQRVAPDVACLQAKLNYHNPHQNLLTRFFTAEYSLWFDVTLTGLQSLNTYIPLGGTSNHFKTASLVELEGWDPFNVTEDCDLGIRLFRKNYKTAIIDSTTLEEANSHAKNWLRQRSRWMKGYMQTYLVHMRHPLKLFRYNGVHAIIFQLVVGGKIAFAMINPFLWLATIAYFTLYSIVGPTIEQLFPPLIFFMAATSLVFGNFLFLYYYMIGCARKNHWSLMKYIYLVPFYWLMTSIASYFALYQLIVKPHYWEKTHHGLHLKIKPSEFFLAPLIQTAQKTWQFFGEFIPQGNATTQKIENNVTNLYRSISYRLSSYQWSWDDNGLHIKKHSAYEFIQAAKAKAKSFGLLIFKIIIPSAPAESTTPQDLQSITDRLPYSTVDYYWSWDNNGPNLRKRSPLSFFASTSKLVQNIIAEKIPYKIKLDNLTSGGILLAAMMISNVLNLLYNAFLGRALTFENLGLITFINTLWFIAGIFIGALSSTVNYRTAYLSTAVGEQASVNFLKKIIKRGAIATVVISAAWLLAIPTLTIFFKLPNYLSLLLFTPILIGGVIAAANQGYLNGTLYFKTVALIILTESVSKLIAAFVLVYAGLGQFAFISIPFSIIVSATASVYLVKNRLNLKAEPAAIIEFPVKFYTASLFAGISAIVFLSFDIILVKHYLSPQIAGEYSLLALIGKMVFFFGALPSIFITTLVSRDVGLNKNSENKLRIILAATAVLVGFGSIGLLTLGRLVIPFIFGAKSLVVLPYLNIYLPAIAMFTLSNVYVSYHLAKKNYFFAGASLIFSVMMSLGIIIYHQNIYQITGVIFITSALSLISISWLNRYEYLYGSIKNNLIDFLGVFANLPTIADNANTKKILIFNWRDTKHKFAGGAEAYIQEMAKQWLKQGHYVTIFCGNDTTCLRNEMVDGVQIIRRGGFYFVYFWAFIYYSLRFRGHYDVIIDCQNGIPFFTPLYSRKKIYCLMHHVHQEVFRQSLAKPLAIIASFLEKDLMPLVYRKIPFITVSNSSKEEIMELGLGQAGIEIVHPGVHLNDLKPGQKSVYPEILYLGRLKAYKSINVLLEAFKIVSEKIPNAKLVIAGSGEEDYKLKKLMTNLNLSDKVSFTGKVNEQQKISLLQKAWVLVNPSFMEGWGITTIEANACATPVIASDVPGLRDSVSNPHTGYLVEYGNRQEFADKMVELIINEKLRHSMMVQCLDWANKFDWIKTSNNFLAIINK
ncbi:MAG: glycosyltransferase [Patescibacteria group bacterium]|nr:glycosyltransferase [Patescibacteria group bacterium]